MVQDFTTIWQVWDSVIFIAGLAIGHGGRHGVDYLVHSIQKIRGLQGQPPKQAQTTQTNTTTKKENNQSQG